MQVYSGRTGELLYQYRGSVARERLGGAVSAIGDLDGDGLDDLLIGASNNTTDYSGGHAYVDTGNDLFLQASANVVREGDTLHLNLRGGEPGNLGLIAMVAIDHARLFIPIVAAPLDDEGNLRVSAIVPPMLTGLSFSMKGLAVPASGHGLIDSSEETVRIR